MELNDRARRLKRHFEIPVFVAALLVVPTIYIEERFADSSMWQTTALVANWAIWAAFFVEYVAMVRVVDDRRGYSRAAWLDIVIIVVSFPLLPALLASTRLLRLSRLARVFRLLRLVRLAAVLTRGGTAARIIFGKHGLGYLIAITALLAIGFGALFATLEGADTQDGLWWSVVTLTTVGYGDFAPATPLGRVVGVGLMIVGIGLVALITAAVAAHFVDEDEDDIRTELKELNGRLQRIESLLEARP